jgi:hypothetical protein
VNTAEFFAGGFDGHSRVLELVWNVMIVIISIARFTCRWSPQDVGRCALGVPLLGWNQQSRIVLFPTQETDTAARYEMRLERSDDATAASRQIAELNEVCQAAAY